MKTIGLIGGMSWESSAEYYRIINEEIKYQLGGTHSAKLLMHSVNFYEIEELQNKGNWDRLSDIMVESALILEKGGADFIVICTNTMHKLVNDIKDHIIIPILHIADTTATEIKISEFKKVGLLGTKFTMEQEFYRGRLINKYDLDVITPDNDERDTIHRIIYEELVLGNILDSSREEYKRIIDKLKSNGAECVILGCTEIGLLIKQEDSSLPIFDTTEIHAKSAARLSLKE